MDTKYNIILTEKAEKDLKEIYKYIFENLKEPNIAMKLMEEIETEILKLENSPYRCMEIEIKPKNQSYRRLIVEKYIVVYRVEEAKKEVAIFEVIYGGRDYLK